MPRRDSRVLLTVIIAALSMIGPFSIDTIFPAFDQIARDVGASATAMQQMTSVYMLSFAVMSLLHGPVSDAVGRKPVMLVGLLVYAGASVLCATSGSLAGLLVGRALQGASAGAGQIISRTVIRDLFSGPAAHRMMAQVSMIFAVAPAVAPIVGGLLLGVGSWPVIFWALAALGLVLAAAVAVGLPETHTAENRTPLRIRPVLHSLRLVLSDGPFLMLAGASMFGFATQFLYIVAAPIIMLQLLGQGEQDFWKLFVPLVAGMMTGSWFSSRFGSRFAPARVARWVFVGLVAVAAVNVAVALSPVGSRLPYAFVVPPLIAFVWSVGFPVLQLLMLDRFPHARGAAASGQSFTMLLFNAALSGVIAPLVATSMAGVAIASAISSVVGAAFWFWYASRERPLRT